MTGLLSKLTFLKALRGSKLSSLAYVGRTRSRFYSSLCHPLRSSTHQQSACKNFPFLFASLGFSFSMFFDKDKDEHSEDSYIDTVKQIMFDAGAAIQNGDLNKSEQLFHLALKSAQDLGNEELVSSIFAKMGVLATIRNDFEKAEDLFTETMRLYFKLGMNQDDNAVIEVSLRLAEVFSKLGKMDAAAEGFKYCIAIQEKKIESVKLEEKIDDDTLALLGISYDGFASFLISLNKVELAKTYWQKALEIAERVLGENSLQTAVILSSLANLSFQKKAYEQSESLLQRAIKIAEAAKSADVLSYYVSLGWVYKERGLDKQAENLFQKSLTLAQSTKNEDLIRDTIELIKG